MPKLNVLENFGQSLRRGVAGYVDAINPIRTFASQQRRKLAAEVGQKAGTMYQRKAIRNNASKAIPFGKRLSAYFNGYNMDDLTQSGARGISRMERPAGSLSKKLYSQVAAKRAMTRRVTAGVLGAATVGTMVFGRDNIVSEGGLSGTTLGLTGLAAGGMASLGSKRTITSARGISTSVANPFATGGAAALVGFTALNMYRSGDQWGPF